MIAHGTMTGRSVSEVLQRPAPALSDDWCFVVRSIDSTRRPTDLAFCLTGHGVRNAIVSGNATLELTETLRAIEAGVFTGFDEVWILANMSPGPDLSAVPSATSDACELAKDGVPSAVATAIQRSKCVLVLADGCGLNYVTTNERLARLLAEIDRDGG